MIIVILLSFIVLFLLLFTLFSLLLSYSLPHSDTRLDSTLVPDPLIIRSYYISMRVSTWLL